MGLLGGYNKLFEDVTLGYGKLVISHLVFLTFSCYFRVHISLKNKTQQIKQLSPPHTGVHIWREITIRTADSLTCILQYYINCL